MMMERNEDEKLEKMAGSRVYGSIVRIGTMGTTAMAMGGGGVDRSDTVAEEERIEKVPSGKATQNSTTSSKAWKKINGVCYNGSGQKLEGAITRGIDVSEWQDTINWSKVKMIMWTLRL